MTSPEPTDETSLILVAESVHGRSSSLWTVVWVVYFVALAVAPLHAAGSIVGFALALLAGWVATMACDEVSQVRYRDEQFRFASGTFEVGAEKLEDLVSVELGDTITGLLFVRFAFVRDKQLATYKVAGITTEGVAAFIARIAVPRARLLTETNETVWTATQTAQRLVTTRWLVAIACSLGAMGRLALLGLMDNTFPSLKGMVVCCLIALEMLGALWISQLSERRTFSLNVSDVRSGRAEGASEWVEHLRKALGGSEKGAPYRS